MALGGTFITEGARHHVMSNQGSHQQALDYHRIKELRSRYAQTIDHAAATGEWEEFVSLYTEDAVVDYPQTTMEGHNEIKAFGAEIEEFYEFSMHTAQMPVIELNGDEATGVWYMFVIYIATDGSEGYVVGRYEDEYRRVDGEWKFSRIEAIISEDTGGFHT